MSSDRSFKIISRLTEVLCLEEEEFEEQDKKFIKTFEKNFKLEIDFLKQKEVSPKSDDLDKEESFKQCSTPLIKKIHKAAAIKTHPDLNPGLEEEFKKIQTAYEEGDIATLLFKALELDVVVDISVKDKEELLNHIEKRRKVLEKKKKSIRWLWGTSQKDKKTRDLIRQNLGIDTQQFDNWIKTKKT